MNYKYYPAFCSSPFLTFLPQDLCTHHCSVWSRIYSVFLHLGDSYSPFMPWGHHLLREALCGSPWLRSSPPLLLHSDTLQRLPCRTRFMRTTCRHPPSALPLRDPQHRTRQNQTFNFIFVWVHSHVSTMMHS